MKQTNITKGILFALTASIISGVAIFYSKISVAKVSPLILTTSRNFYVGILFLLLFIFSGKLSELKKLQRKQLAMLLLVGLIGGALPFYLFFTGLQSVQSTTANLIQKSLFIWVTVLAVIFLKEKINVVYVISFILIAVANYFFGGLKITFSSGEIMILAAALLWSFESVLAKKVLKNVSSDMVGLFRMGIGGSMLMIVTLLTSKAKFLLAIQQSNNVTIVFIGGTILFFYVFTWFKALKYTPASLVTLILTFAVVVGNILNGAFANVKILPKDFYSSLLLSLAILLIISQKDVIPNLFRNLHFKKTDPEINSG